MTGGVLILGYEFFVARLDRMTLTLRVAELVFCHIHNEPGDRPDCLVRARTRPLVLALLVIGFPEQTQSLTSILTLHGKIHQLIHLVLVHLAAKSKPSVANQQDRRRRQRRHFNKLPASC